MRKRAKELINELQRTKAFMGTCPSCGGAFRLTDATLFSIDDTPPEEARAAILGIREAIKVRREELARTKTRMTGRAQITAQAVNLGKIVEKIVPSFASFEYAPGDCRALFEPIDYLIFPGLTNRQQVEAIHFVDVKSGSARLATKQKAIKETVEAGLVKFTVMGSRE